MRLDQYLVEKGYFQSRNKARTSIDEGAIKVNGNVCMKASFDILDSDKIEIIKDVCPYVSRGGLKLQAAIENFFLGNHLTKINSKIVLNKEFKTICATNAHTPKPL